jgi:hypothetical protein
MQTICGGPRVACERLVLGIVNHGPDFARAQRVSRPSERPVN